MTLVRKIINLNKNFKYVYERIINFKSLNPIKIDFLEYNEDSKKICLIKIKNIWKNTIMIII